MSRDRASTLELSRRSLLQLGVGSAVVASLPWTLPHAQAATQSCAPPIPPLHGRTNGGVCPYPIPWLDKNGNHNQMLKPDAELSNIYHFKGKLARCAGFTGTDSDNKGNRLAWGTPRPTTATWPGNTGPYVRGTKPSSPISD